MTAHDTGAETLSRPVEPLGDGAVSLAPLGPEHLRPLAALGNDPGVRRYTRVPEPFGEAEAEWWLGLYEQGWLDGSRAGFAIVDHTGSFLGMIAFVSLRLDQREAEAGYIVAPVARGRGVATRALELLTRWGFQELGLARIELRVEVDNHASLRVAERCGYGREGVLRNVHVKRNRRGDMAIYARLETDFPSAVDA
jgi:RimJ/RimL family protein N-acetyltransferase